MRENDATNLPLEPGLDSLNLMWLNLIQAGFFVPSTYGCWYGTNVPDPQNGPYLFDSVQIISTDGTPIPISQFEAKFLTPNSDNTAISEPG